MSSASLCGEDEVQEEEEKDNMASMLRTNELDLFKHQNVQNLRIFSTVFGH